MNKEEAPSCENCRYIRFDPNDKDEYEECSISGRYNEFDINEKVLKRIVEEGLTGVCEYWQQR